MTVKLPMSTYGKWSLSESYMRYKSIKNSHIESDHSLSECIIGVVITPNHDRERNYVNKTQLD